MRGTIRRSKTDQEGNGQEVAIPTVGRLRAAATMREWLAAADITSDRVLRPVDSHGRTATPPLTDRSVAGIVKAYVARVGLNL